MKRPTIIHIISITLMAILVCSCTSRPEQTDNRPVAAVTTSYLECCLKDAAGDHFKTARLIPPGLCPGHFDVSPKMIEDIRKSSILLRFEFQDSLDDKISHLSKESLVITGIKAPEGLSIPDSYLYCLKQLEVALKMRFPEKSGEFDIHIEEAEKRLENLGEECLKKISNAGLKGEKVIASGHQAEFCGWLGLNVTAAYSGAGATTPSDLKKIIDQGKESGVSYIIANRQEGGGMAEALAQKLGAEIVVFSNFPEMSPEEDSFFELVQNNVQNLVSKHHN